MHTHTHTPLQHSGSSCPLQCNWTVQTNSETWPQLEKVAEQLCCRGGTECSSCKKHGSSSRGCHLTWHRWECKCDWSGIGTSCIVGEKKKTKPHSSQALHTHAYIHTHINGTLAATVLFTQHSSPERLCKSSRRGCANMALKDYQFTLHNYQAYKITICTAYGTQKQYWTCISTTLFFPPFHAYWQQMTAHCLTDQ